MPEIVTDPTNAVIAATLANSSMSGRDESVKADLKGRSVHRTPLSPSQTST